MFHENIIKLARENTYFRHVLANGNYSQIVLMSLLPGEDIGKEVHKVDQILIFVEGTVQAELNGRKFNASSGDLVLVPSGTEHNFTNITNLPVKLYTIYTPAQHPAGTIHKTKKDAEKAEY